jgi:cob(I)alamin adenosyltransferase
MISQVPELIEIADTVTDMQEVKHAFKNGIVAQAGVEW